jgi:hypothetical protein
MSSKPFDIIYLDIDGVLADFVGGVLSMYKSYSYDEITQPDMAAILKISPDKFWGQIDMWGGAFWENLQLLPNAKAIMEECQRLAGHVVLLTSPSLDVNSRHGKIRWVENHFGRVDVCFSSHGKHPYAGGPRTLLVDDFDKNVDAFREAGGAALLVPRPWNCRRNITLPYRTELQRLIELVQDTHINLLKPTNAN